MNTFTAEGAENTEEDGYWSGVIIGAAIEVHRILGPGLLESAYEECLAYELSSKDVPFERQVAVPVVYKGEKLDCGFRVDLIIAKQVVVELKSIERLLPVHDAQLITYLRLTRIPIGLILNFNVHSMRDGIRRRVLSQ